MIAPSAASGAGLSGPASVEGRLQSHAQDGGARRDPQDARIRILIADDHFIVRMGLKGVLDMQPDMQVVAEAEDGPEAIRRFREERPDVALVDLRMPGMSGTEAITAILGEFPDARLIAVSAFDGDDLVHRAFQAGARGYVPKKVPGEELLKAIRAVHGGQRYLPGDIGGRLADVFHRTVEP